MGFLDDVKTHLTGSWNTGTIALPEIEDISNFTNKKGIVKYPTNYVLLDDQGVDYDQFEPSITYRDELYSMVLEIGSKHSESNRDSYLSEVKRILGQTGMTNYSFRNITSIKEISVLNNHKSELWYETRKYNQNI